ncbi:MAG TPA: hypothetical protein VLT59_07255 [Steroidobacteraceae bacterium]|nr:hypothetical protein [Steroidobacteraceae bacterium]
MSVTRVLAVAVTALAAAATVQAQPKPAEAAYRCTDDSGRTHMSDSMPPECIGRDVEVLNERGRVLRVIEGEATRAARLEREAQEEAERLAREEQAELDRVLLDTYQSVEEIERLRDQRLELLASQVTVTEQNIATLLERQQRLEAQVQRFRPYSDAPKAGPLPDHLAEEIVNTVESLRIYREQIATKEAEQQELRTRFDRDAARFRELKANR